MKEKYAKYVIFKEDNMNETIPQPQSQEEFVAPQLPCMRIVLYGIEIMAVGLTKKDTQDMFDKAYNKLHGLISKKIFERNPITG